jgi:hypothetical protein
MESAQQLNINVNQIISYEKAIHLFQVVAVVRKHPDPVRIP